MVKDVPVLYLIDISSYFYRAFHALPALSNSRGVPTNAAYGVTTMLLKVLRAAAARHLALVFDAKGPPSVTYFIRHTRRTGRPCPRPW